MKMRKEIFCYSELKQPEKISGGRLWPLEWVEQILRTCLEKDITVKEVLGIDK